MKIYKNIIFDLGDVLVNWNPNKFFNSIFKDNQKEDWKEFLAEENNELWADFNRGKLSLDDLSNDFNIEFGKEKTQLLFEKVPQNLFLLDDGIKILNRAREKGYKLYILSNFPKEMFESASLIHNYEEKLLNKFDGMVFSYKVKSTKPEPEIYNALLKTYNLNPAECLFIDDKEINIIAGEKLGIDGIVCNDHEQLEKDLIDKGII